MGERGEREGGTACRSRRASHASSQSPSARKHAQPTKSVQACPLPLSLRLLGRRRELSRTRERAAGAFIFSTAIRAASRRWCVELSGRPDPTCTAASDRNPGYGAATPAKGERATEMCAATGGWRGETLKPVRQKNLPFIILFSLFGFGLARLWRRGRRAMRQQLDRRHTHTYSSRGAIHTSVNEGDYFKKPYNKNL